MFIYYKDAKEFSAAPIPHRVDSGGVFFDALIRVGGSGFLLDYFLCLRANQSANQVTMSPTINGITREFSTGVFLPSTVAINQQPLNPTGLPYRLLNGTTRIRIYRLSDPPRRLLKG